MSDEIQSSENQGDQNTSGGSRPNLGPFSRLLDIPGVTPEQVIGGFGGGGGNSSGGASGGGGSGNPFTNFGNPNASGSPLTGGTNPWSQISSGGSSTGGSQTSGGFGGGSQGGGFGGGSQSTGGSNQSAGGGFGGGIDFETANQSLAFQYRVDIDNQVNSSLSEAGISLPFGGGGQSSGGGNPFGGGGQSSGGGNPFGGGGQSSGGGFGGGNTSQSSGITLTGTDEASVRTFESQIWDLVNGSLGGVLTPSNVGSNADVSVEEIDLDGDASSPVVNPEEELVPVAEVFTPTEEDSVVSSIIEVPVTEDSAVILISEVPFVEGDVFQGIEAVAVETVEALNESVAVSVKTEYPTMQEFLDILNGGLVLPDYLSDEAKNYITNNFSMIAGNIEANRNLFGGGSTPFTDSSNPFAGGGNNPFAGGGNNPFAGGGNNPFAGGGFGGGFGA